MTGTQAPWWQSITARLVLYYSVCTGVVLLTAIAVLYWAVVASIANDDRHFLAEKLHVLRTMLQERPDDQSLLNEEVDWETRVLAHARYFVQIEDRGGRVLAQTPGLDRSGIPLGDFPAPIPLGSTTPALTWARTPSGRRYLLAAAQARLGSATTPQRIVRIALDVSHEDRILTDFRHIALLVLLAGVLVSALLGLLIARRGLRPIATMVETLRGTTAARLDQRIEPTAWPRELSSLALSLNGMLARLSEAFARISGYAADLAHELRSPLNNLRGEAEVALARRRSASEYRDVLESSLEETQRLAQLVDSLLFLAHAENPQAQLRRSEFAVRPEVDSLLEFYELSAEEAGIGVSCEGTAILHADRELVRRAVGNLLSNAIRHTAAGGVIRVTIAQARDGATGITVSDNGSGMDMIVQSQAFDRFYRGREARGRGVGSGLGLAIVQSIMTLHGGRVDLASEPGQGTRVSLWFPGLH